MEKRYFYKDTTGKYILSLKTPLDISQPINNVTYFEITEQEFIELSKSRVKPLTERQKKLKRIEELRHKLKDLDYIGIKIATGRATREEYASEIILMQTYADEINHLQNEL